MINNVKDWLGIANLFNFVIWRKKMKYRKKLNN